MQPHNYFLVLFEIIPDCPPKAVGQKAITKEQYEQFGNDMFKSFVTGEQNWRITERRIFEMAEQKKMFELESAITVNCFAIIDAIKY